MICPDDESRKNIMWYATQACESYPYYQHEVVGYNYRLSNISACIGRAQMTVLNEYIAHRRHCRLYTMNCSLMSMVLHCIRLRQPNLIPTTGYVPPLLIRL